jgi:hypothetical protein
LNYKKFRFLVDLVRDLVEVAREEDPAAAGFPCRFKDPDVLVTVDASLWEARYELGEASVAEAFCRALGGVFCTEGLDLERLIFC